MVFNHPFFLTQIKSPSLFFFLQFFLFFCFFVFCFFVSFCFCSRLFCCVGFRSWLMVAFPPSSSLWILFILCSFVSTKIFQNSLSDSEIDQLQIRKRLSHSPFSYEKYWRRAALLAMREPHEVSEYQPYNDCLRVI